MNSCYEVVLLHRDLDQFAEEVADAVNQTADGLLERTGVLHCRTDLSQSGGNAPVTVAYLGNKAGQRDDSIREALNRALALHFPILPIVRREDPGDVHEKLPSAISAINAIQWDDARERTVTTLLGMLGLVERERRLFLSYVRRDSDRLAEQLHRVLVQSGFDVFLDRFTLPPGSDVNRRIDEELADKAFVVLLESAGFAESRWVQHEIAYALRHRMGILALSLPNEGEVASSVDDAFRIRLNEQDFLDCELTQNALDAVVGEIELAHAQAIRRRREQMLGTLTERLEENGRTWTPIGPWTIQAVSDDNVPSLYRVTPRRPRPHDLYALDIARTSVKRSDIVRASAVVVHGAGDIDKRKQVVLDWIGESTGLAVKSIDSWPWEMAA